MVLIDEDDGDKIFCYCCVGSDFFFLCKEVILEFVIILYEDFVR